jgi:hypothetical protein
VQVMTPSQVTVSSSLTPEPLSAPAVSLRERLVEALSIGAIALAIALVISSVGS